MASGHLGDVLRESSNDGIPDDNGTRTNSDFDMNEDTMKIKKENEVSITELANTGLYLADDQDPNSSKTEESDRGLEDIKNSEANGAYYLPEHFLYSNEGLNVELPNVVGASAQSLYTRTLSDSRKDDFTCNVCNKTFKDKRDCIRHIRVHTGEKPFRCNQCGFSFGCEYNLKRHVETHTGEKPFPCSVCNRHFARKEYMQQHKLLHSDDTEKPFPCHLCGKGYVKRSYLDRHLKTHVKVLEFFCSICGEGFYESRGLVSHMSRLHSGNRPFPCSVCKREFKKEHLLNKHMLTHTNSPLETSEFHSLFGNMISQNNCLEVINNNTESHDSDTFENSTDDKISTLHHSIFQSSIEDVNKTETPSDNSERINNEKECQNVVNLDTLNGDSGIMVTEPLALHDEVYQSLEGSLENPTDEKLLKLHHSLFQSPVQDMDKNKTLIDISEMVNNKKRKRSGNTGIMVQEQLALNNEVSQSTVNNTLENPSDEKLLTLHHSLFQSSVQDIDTNKPLIGTPDMVNIKKECQNLETIEPLTDNSDIMVKEEQVELHNDVCQSTVNDTLENFTDEKLSIFQHSIFQPSVQETDNTETSMEISESSQNYDLQSTVTGTFDNFSGEELSTLHPVERPFSCSMCKKGFTKKTYLQQHMFTHGDITERPYQCHMCSNGFTKRSHYDRHLKTHSKVLDFFCTICGQGFFENRGLVRHMKYMHSGIRPFPCSICKQEFKKEHLLQKHMLTHTNSNSSIEASESHSLFGSMLGQNDVSGKTNKDKESHNSDMFKSSADGEQSTLQPSVTQSSGNDIDQTEHMIGIPEIVIYNDDECIKPGTPDKSPDNSGMISKQQSPDNSGMISKQQSTDNSGMISKQQSTDNSGMISKQQLKFFIEKYTDDSGMLSREELELFLEECTDDSGMISKEQLKLCLNKLK